MQYQIKTEKSYEYNSKNSTLIKEIEFATDGIYWKVLQMCNTKVLSIEQIDELLGHTTTGEETLSEVISNLQIEGLIYCNNDQTEILTILDTHKVVNMILYGTVDNTATTFFKKPTNTLLVS